jgi:hypothetical protein
MTYRMSKQFAMLTATRRLEKHLSRESFNLHRMADNDRIPYSLLETKVAHHNELVNALNDLFASLSESPSSKLFTYHNLPSLEEESFTVVSHAEADEEEHVSAEQVAFEIKPDLGDEEDGQDESEPDVPLWQSGGYDTYDAWLADKEAEFTQNDLTLGVNDGLSRHRAQQALDEYSETSERDIATYLPEDDHPVNVLPSAGCDDESMDKTIDSTDYNYLDHTVDNVRVDSDPTQIAGVETAVERYGENARRGTDIDVSSFLYQSEGLLVDGLINDDIERLQRSPVGSMGDGE